MYEDVQPAPSTDGLPTLQDWADAMRAVSLETGVGMGFEGLSIEHDPSAPVYETGALLPLVGRCVNVQLGLLGERAALEHVARTLCMMEPDEEIDWEDATDAVSEVVNVIAGALKTAMIDRVPTLRLGLPMFADGFHHRTGGSRSVMRARMPGAEFTFVVALGRPECGDNT